MPITSASYKGYAQTGPFSFDVKTALVHSTKPTYNKVYRAAGTTAAQIRDNVSRQIADDVDAEALDATLAGIAIDTNIPITRPVDPPPTAQEVWVGKARRLSRAKQLDLTNPPATYTADLTALEADVVATYQPGYLSSF